MSNLIDIKIYCF